MELPFLKDKRKSTGPIVQEAETLEEQYNKQLLEHSIKEFMEACHKKDIASIRSSFKAICSVIKG
jgi:hypothetical protein